uniref:Uncharacterized protein n=1 Tax=Rhizophora mucronata TaxID=61149 RepID=A0A2P2PQ18_RHIMU
MLNQRRTHLLVQSHYFDLKVFNSLTNDLKEALGQTEDASSTFSCS